jgi:hypothetical protein
VALGVAGGAADHNEADPAGLAPSGEGDFGDLQVRRGLGLGQQRGETFGGAHGFLLRDLARPFRAMSAMLSA